MPKILHIKSYSLNAKIVISLLLLALFLLTILFSLIIPKMEEDEYNKKIKEVDQVLAITKNQIKLAGKAIVMQSELEIKSNQILLENQLLKIKDKINDNLTIKQVKELVEQTSIPKLATYKIKNNEKYIINKSNKLFIEYKIKSYNKWEEYRTKERLNDYLFSEVFHIYSLKLNNQLEITVFAKEDNLNINHHAFEKILKEDIQNTFNINQSLHKGKTYMFWLNSKYENEDNTPLYIKDTKKSEEKYTISKMSNVTNIYTGNLTAKQIMTASNKSYVRHKLNNKEAISWIINVYNQEYDGYIFLLVKTIYKEDLQKHIDSSFLKVFPAALLSLLLVIIIGFFLFKKLFKSINILTSTAKEVNKGNKKIRSNVTGSDDIGYLGIAFDSMLDSFENNIKNLDYKVKEKTKKLQSSLEEKDILLKEIHHRVKNNLALTISLIKLQQEEIKEKKSQKALIDIQERIYTMELLHRKLYESTNLNKINFREYILSLLSSISKTYKNKYRVNINTRIDEIYIDIEKAMPCGLILNEIITNAFKYAFNNNLNPQLFISMKKEKELICLTIRDNGKGINKDIDIHNSNTLGLKLITLISKRQLKGTIEYSYKKGACFTIMFLS